MLYTFQDLFFSVSLAVHVAVSLVVAFVRWGHKCEPYARHMEYYYPAWKVIVLCFLSSIVLVPAVFKPQDIDSIMQLRITLMLTSPFYCAVMLFTYFGKVLRLSWWKRPIIALSIPFGLLLFTGFVLTVYPGNQIVGLTAPIIFSLTGIFSLLSFGSFVMALRMIARAMRRFSEENYSNVDDFPRNYASRVIYIPVLHVAISWICAFIGTKDVLSAGVLLQAVLNVRFLIGALSPHRAREVEKLEAGEIRPETVAEPMANLVLEEAAAAEEDSSLSQERRNVILQTLHQVVEEDQAYLDCHLTLATLARSCGVNRTYISRVMNDNLGGFFNYVNRFRLTHADQLRAEHPDLSVDEIAIASGFGSRQSYYNIRRALGR